MQQQPKCAGISCCLPAKLSSSGVNVCSRFFHGQSARQGSGEEQDEHAEDALTDISCYDTSCGLNSIHSLGNVSALWENKVGIIVLGREKMVDADSFPEMALKTGLSCRALLLVWIRA